jgi:ethanolaminephosphotransferase
MVSYVNVLAARRKAGKPLLTPLLGYLPFMTHTLILVLWLQAGVRGGQEMIQSATLLPFIGYWGMRCVPSIFSYTAPELISK